MLAGLRELGKTIFLTTHYMEEAERLADRIAVIAAGEIVDEGTPSTIGNRDRADTEITFVLPAGLRASRPAGRPAGAGRGPGATAREVRMRSVAPLPDLQRLGAWLDGRGAEIAELEVHRPSLEDVYLKLTAASEPARRRGDPHEPRPPHHPVRPAGLRRNRKARLLTLVFPLLLLVIFEGVFHGGKTRSTGSRSTTANSSPPA